VFLLSSQSAWNLREPAGRGTNYTVAREGVNVHRADQEASADGAGSRLTLDNRPGAA
jgi:hypothetical protein